MNRSIDDADARRSGGAVEEAILNVLAGKPVVHVPEDFAGQVTRRALAQPQPSRSLWMGWGAKLTVGSAALLTVGMFALAPHAAPTLGNVPFYGELILLGELGGLLLFSRRLLGHD